MTIVEKLSKYIKDSYYEMKHVTWPTKEEVRRHTILVIAMSLAVAAFLGLADYLLQIGLGKLIVAVK